MVGHRRRRHLRALIGALAACGLAGCASGGSPHAPRASAYLRAVEARIAGAADATRFLLRHNPAGCDCPPFEVQLGDAWQRTELVGVEADDPTVQALEAAVDAEPEAELVVEGHLEGDPATCGRGTLVVSLVPTAFVGAPTHEP